jgi:hypothetical protein
VEGGTAGVDLWEVECLVFAWRWGYELALMFLGRSTTIYGGDVVTSLDFSFVVVSMLYLVYFHAAR